MLMLHCYKETNIAGLGIIARDEKGNVILAATKVQFDCFDAEEAELLACREALLLAIQWIPDPVTVETDCYVIFQALNSLSENRSRLALQVKETRALADELQEAEFVLTKREQNKVADLLTKHACKDLSSALWL